MRVSIILLLAQEGRGGDEGGGCEHIFICICQQKIKLHRISRFSGCSCVLVLEAPSFVFSCSSFASKVGPIFAWRQNWTNGCAR